MGIAIVFPSQVVVITTVWFMRCQFFKPAFVIPMKPRLIIIDEDGSGDMHCVDKTHPFLDSTFLESGYDIGSDVDEIHPLRNLHPEFFVI